MSEWGWWIAGGIGLVGLASYAFIAVGLFVFRNMDEVPVSGD